MELSHKLKAAAAATALALVTCGLATAADAQKPAATTVSTTAAPQMAAAPIPQPPQFPLKAYVLIDYQTGRVLAENKSTERMEPASLTKIMTGYIVFDAIKSGRLKMTDTVVISEHAWRSEGSRSFVQVGTSIPVEDLVKGMIVQSGNDATIALAEKIGGSEDGFVQMMNAKAKHLGLTGTNFANAWGGPSPQHYSTALDLALLSQALIRDFPEHYRLYSLKEYVWGGIRQENRNGLLGRDGIDGIKTGHTDSALYCLATSAKRNDMRLISIVLGAPSIRGREESSAALMNYGFTFYETMKVRDGDRVVLTPRIYKGAQEFVKVGAPQDIYVTIARGEGERIRKDAEVDKPLMAPMSKGRRVGTYSITLDGKQIAQAPLVTLEETPEAGFFGRMSDTVRLWFE